MATLQPPTKVLFIGDKENEITRALEQAEFKVEVGKDVIIPQEKLKMLRPDLIIVSSNMTSDHGLSFCLLVKSVQIIPRPIIVFLVDEEKSDEKVEVLRAGADDVITIPVSGKEVAFRVMAHLRRRQETRISMLTGLPDSVIANNVLDHCIQEVKDWALLSIDLNNLRIYNETYGEVRGDQMIKALAAVLKSVLVNDDLVSHRDSDDFILITRSDRAESLAEEICRRFDFIAPRFYTSEDAQRGYVIGVGPKGIRRRIPLVSISIGITARERRHFTSAVEVFQVARDMRYLAKSKSGSDWVSDRLRLAQAESAAQAEKRIKILIVEPDASMALLLRDTLEMEGYSVEASHSPEEAWSLILNWHPELILLETDISVNDFDGWELSKKLKQDPNLSHIWLVMTTKNSDHRKALSVGADLYLPKPYELQVLFSEIRYLLRARIRSKVLL